ncbi:uncharacterized protein J8A68_002666 [[Candida] subhashii]|uniref:Zn(2)-C6 fungal-type domain-containing protein n=1 Tax=[Candida] subhashii TaxID=561895 RepID=A0A8J5QNI7_9ASCO|nr:uncharacterized protein J8A68_002666 [[Candida] subhashii]KAG7663806.1 hypothetical protein J8A68_002666 [[Candida] subhashii]
MLVTFNSRARDKTKSLKAISARPSSPIMSTPPELETHKITNPDTPSSTTTSIGSKKGSVKIIQSSKDFYKFKETSRSKNGCLTCKIRKKKCDETRPICSDCKRLKKKCTWADYDSMTELEIKKLKQAVEKEESKQKLRKRKSKAKRLKSETDKADIDGDNNDNTNENDNGIKQNDDEADKIIHEPNTVNNETNGLYKVSSFLSDSGGDPLKIFGYNSNLRSTQTESHSTEPDASPNGPPSPTLSSLMNPILDSNAPNPPTTNPQEMAPLFDYKEQNSPGAFLSFLRELSGHIPHESSNKIEDLENNDQTINNNNNSHMDVRDIMSSNEFTSLIHSLEEPYHDYDGNSALTTLSPAQRDYNQNLISNLNSFLTPIPPSPSYIPELADPTCSYLYNYYVEVVSKKVSIAPISQNESNSYQKIFLPLAHKDKGVFYSILAWSGYFLGGRWEEEGMKYADYAVKHMGKIINRKGMTQEDRQTIVNKLATLMILCGAEICKGDVKNWSVFLNWGWKLLAGNGGILNFNKSKEEHWLISNFAYHDLLASSTTERGTYFPSEEYDMIFMDKEGFSKASLNPLLGVSKKLFKLIGDISTLVYESKKILSEFYNREFSSPTIPVSQPLIQEDEDENMEDQDDFIGSPLFGDASEISDHGKASRLLQSVIEKVKTLEFEIDSSKPEKEDLMYLTDQELELQLTLFEAFQISAKLFLRQSIMKCNPSMLESQVLNNDLIKCLDILVGTSVQASLVFPIFMSGIHCVTKHDQDVMRYRIGEFMKLYGIWNVSRVRFVLEKIWESNPAGNMVVDWHQILNDLNWDLNFA